MKNLYFMKLWIALSILWLGLVMDVSLEANPPNVMFVSYGDKLAHMTTYFCLMLWFAQIFSRENHKYAGAMLIAFGLLIEVLQGAFTATRSFELADMAANCTGLVLGWLAASTNISRVIVGLEARFLPRKV